MVKKFDAVAEALAKKVVLKVEIRRLRRQAREEVRAMKKAGVKLIDEKTLEIHIRDDDWLLKHQNDIRQEVRMQGRINVGNNVYLKYGEVYEAKQNQLLHNRRVDAWNERHKAEIQAGTLERRIHKPWSIGQNPDDTEEDMQAWIDNLRTNFGSSADYYRGLWGTYITNTMKAVRRRCPVGLDFIITFFDKKLREHVPVTNGDYYELKYYYAEKDLLKAYRDLAEHYGFLQDWVNLISAHDAEIKSVFRLM